MSRRDNARNRCRVCAMHLSLCLCQEIPTIATSTRLCLVMHRDETIKTTNTGRLALRCLSNHEVLVHGREGDRLAAPWHVPSGAAISGGLLLFPCDEAEPLSEHHAASGPVRLIVPDGTWRQAAKMPRRIGWMSDLPRVSLPEGSCTSYRLRSEPKRGGLATMEAIARALGILESPEVQVELETIFRKMIDRTLYSRGLLPREEVFGGVPRGVMRHLTTRPYSPVIT